MVSRDSGESRHYADGVSYTHLTLPLLHSGKVRELYELPEGQILLVATDNVSAYDRVLPTPIPHKGEVLTRLTAWWLHKLGELAPHHGITDEVPAEVAGRALVVEKLDMIPVECVARGYLAGSAWREYSETGAIAGQSLPEGLAFGARLAHPIFTPARKAPQGEHDENITYDQLVEIVGDETAARLKALTLRLYIRAERIARERGLILVDTKFEFGRREDGTIVLGDEVLTPDSSRYWDAAAYASGTDLESFDKQYLRDWVTSDSGWNVDSGEPAPELPDDVVAGTRARYVETYERLTGEQFVPAHSGDTEAGAEPAADTEGTAGSEGSAGAADSAASADEPEIEQPTAMVVVDVMPKPEILDPQGKAVTGALKRLGYEGLSVRQGKRFEIEVYGELTSARLDQIVKAAETLLANTVIEEYEVSVYTDECTCEDCGAEDENDEGCCGGGGCCGGVQDVEITEQPEHQQ